MGDNVQKLSGGCQCGAVRYQVTGEVGHPHLCHCRMCQRWTGAVFIEMDVQDADISFTSEYIKMGIDGMGMSGKDDHTINETGDLRALPKQSKRAAVLIYRLFKEVSK